MAHALSGTGARILLVERGGFVPQEPENTDPAAVWKHLRYRTTEPWLDGDGREFLPYTHYCVGGNTKFWGSVLYRLRREDFGEIAARRRRLAGVADRLRDARAVLRPRRAALPRARRSTGADPDRTARAARSRMRPIPHAPRMAEIVDELRGFGLHPSPLPLGLIRPGEADGCVLCNTCNSFPCRIHAEERGRRVLRAARPGARRTVTLWTNAFARRLLTDAARTPRGRGGNRQRTARRSASRRRSSSVACGAVNSAALLLRSANDAHPGGLGEPLGPRRPPLHGAPRDDAAGRLVAAATTTVFQKTLGDQRLSTFEGPTRRIRSGRSSRRGARTAIMAKTVGDDWRWPISGASCRSGCTSSGSRARVDWLAMTEDLPHEDNRVVARARRAHSAVVPAEQPPRARAARRRDCAGCSRGSAAGRHASSPTRPAPATRRTSAARSCSAPTRARSVLDPFCRAHDVENLFVVDASFFPSSAAVNPALTIVAQALRVADHIKDTAALVRGHSRARSILQPRRPHGVGLQQGRAVLLGRVRLPARRRGRHAARARARLLRRAGRRAELQDRLDPRAGRRRARDLRVRAEAAGDRRCRGTASA